MELQITIQGDKLIRWRDLLRDGWEHAYGALIEHDSSLGRTTIKNKRWAEQLETDMEAFKQEYESINNRLPLPLRKDF
jgi:hypothetical protein